MLSVLRQLRSTTDWQFTAIAPGEGLLVDQLQELGVPVDTWSRSGSSPAGAPTNSRPDDDDLIRLATKAGPDLLHANSLSMSRRVGRLVSQLPATVSCTGHIRDIMKLSRAAIRDVNQLQTVACVSEATRNFHLNQGLLPQKSAVVYNGVDLSRFRPRARNEQRQLLLPDVPPQDLVLLNVGQICLRKGQLDLAEALTELPVGDRAVHLVMLGTRHSTKQESVDYEQKIVQTLSHTDSVVRLHRVGYQPNVEQWMNAADLLVHPARQEPLGRVLLEAAASGLPIIATDVGGTAEIIPHEAAVRLVPPADPTALTAVLKDVLAQQIDVRSTAAAALLRVQQNFDVRHAAAQLRHFWQAHLTDSVT